MVLFLLFIQLVFILFLIAGTHMIFSYLNIFFRGLSLIVCIYILNRQTKYAYKLLWIFVILLFPIFGGIVYVFFQTQFTSRKLRRQVQRSNIQYETLFSPKGDTEVDLNDENKDNLPLIKYLNNYAKYPVYKNTQAVYCDSGEKFFELLLEELEKAEKYIFMEFFVLRQGEMFDPIIDILERKARQGLDIRMIYDDVGCFTSLPPNFNTFLEEKGIKCLVFNPFKAILTSSQNNRDHRKIVSIDGKTAFTGGINLADEYINAEDRFGHWKDAAIMIQGMAAWSLTLIFLHMWNLEKSRQEDPMSFYPWKNNEGEFVPCGVKSDGLVQPYADSPFDSEHVGENVYIHIFKNAKNYVYINTPYLVVDDTLLSSLILSAKSGVDVRIITPYRWDKIILGIVSRSYYRHLINSGVKVYEYTKGFNHSKTFISDDRVATVGTTNLDFRSLYLHFECGVCLYNNSAIEKIKEDFLNTLLVCRQITLRDCSRNTLQNIVQDVLRVFAPIL